jgi:quinol monooxygenase YgiN
MRLVAATAAAVTVVAVKITRAVIGTLGASFLAIFSGAATAQEPSASYVQLAELEIDPAQLEAYNAAVREHIQAAIRAEPGVLVLYAVAHNDDPARITVFEVYKDMAAYKVHLEAPHFKKYKAAVEKMVKSLKLMPVTPVMLGTK